MTPDELAKSIDHTLLEADATPDNIRKVCEEAKKYSFATVFVNPCYVSLAVSLLRGLPVKVGTTIGFPLGATTTNIKCFEATQAILHGARELDMVMHIGALKFGHAELVEEDIRAVVDAVRTEEVESSAGDIIVKVIIETCYLTDEEKRLAVRIAGHAGADFVKTSTGLGVSGATARDVKLLREAASLGIGIKASGGIRTFKQAIKMLDAGATRIGTSSSTSIMKEAKKRR